jgi:hypothetical protein
MSTDLESAFSSAMEMAGSDEGGTNDSDLTQIHLGDDLPSGDTDFENDVEIDETETADTDEVDVDEVELSDDEFDLAAAADRKVTVKVAGQPVTVTMREMADGYMRQADYTRKTQELKGYVAWAQEVQNALNTDPQGTIRQMAEYFGVGVQAADPVDPYEDIDPDLVPYIKQNEALAAEVQRMKSEFERQSQDRVLNEVRAEMEAVKAAHPDFDPQEVLPVAASKGLTIQEAYELVSYRKYQASQSAAAAAQAKAKAKADAVASKKAASGRVGSGATLKGSATPPQFAEFGELLEFNMRNS